MELAKIADQYGADFGKLEEYNPNVTYNRRGSLDSGQKILVRVREYWKVKDNPNTYMKQDGEWSVTGPPPTT